MTPDELHKWNSKLYGLGGELGAEWFWTRHRIRSAPKFRDECWSHIPHLWEGAVTKLITKIQKTYGNKVEFRQIKEKYIHLTVYYQVAEEVGLIEADKIQSEVDKMIKEAQDELRKLGLHA